MATRKTEGPLGPGVTPTDSSSGEQDDKAATLSPRVEVLANQKQQLPVLQKPHEMSGVDSDLTKELSENILVGKHREVISWLNTHHTDQAKLAVFEKVIAKLLETKEYAGKAAIVVRKTGHILQHQHPQLHWELTSKINNLAPAIRKQGGITLVKNMLTASFVSLLGRAFRFFPFVRGIVSESFLAWGYNKKKHGVNDATETHVGLLAAREDAQKIKQQARGLLSASQTHEQGRVSDANPGMLSTLETKKDKSK